MAAPSEWYKDNFFVSTKSSLIDPDAVNEAFHSEFMYWCRAFDDKKLLKTMLDSSLCFGIYQMPTTASEIAGKSNLYTLSIKADHNPGRTGPKQIGLARLITDSVTFGYLTDVYVLPEFQGRGLGSWLISCVNEHVSTWKELRRIMLITSGAPKFYEEHLGMKNFNEGGNGMFIMSRKGSGSVLQE